MSLENKIRLFIVKQKIKKSLLEMRLSYTMKEIRKKLGDKLSSVDPYGEEDWDD